MIPEAGGSASFARRGFNDFLGSIAGWALAFSYIQTMAISAFAVSSYLGYFWAPLKDSATIGTIVAMGIVFLLMWLNVMGVKRSTVLNSAFAVLDIVTQILIIVLAIVFLFSAPIVFQRITAYWPSVSELIFGIAVAAIAYTGIETISQFAEEAKHPTVTAPRALVLMMVVVLILYGGIFVAAFSSMTPPEMASAWARDPMAGIAHGFSMGIVPETAFLAWLLKFVPVLVAILAATVLTIATNAGLMGISRLPFSLGKVSTYASLFVQGSSQV